MNALSGGSEWRVRIMTMIGGCIEFTPQPDFNFQAFTIQILNLGYFHSLGPDGCIFVPLSAIASIFLARADSGQIGEFTIPKGTMRN